MKEFRYEFSKKERRRIQNFIKKHNACKSSVCYIFSSSGGIGQSVSVMCNFCKEVKDVTDYETW